MLIKMKYDKPTMMEMTIDPKLAKFLLTVRSENQIPVRQKFVLLLAHEMEENQWKDLNGDSIKFDINGKLIDGQHRLLAVIKSGNTIKTFAVFGLPEDYIWSFDTVIKKRRVGDYFFSNHIKNYNAIGSAMTLLWRYDNDFMDSDSSIYPNALEAWELYQNNTEIDDSFIFARKINQLLTIGSSVFLHYIFARIDRMKANEMFLSLSTGANLEINSPVLILKNKLSYYRKPGTQARLSMKNYLALSIIAWNKYRKGEKISNLRWSGKKFPKAE